MHHLQNSNTRSQVFAPFDMRSTLSYHPRGVHFVSDVVGRYHLRFALTQHIGNASIFNYHWLSGIRSGIFRLEQSGDRTASKSGQPFTNQFQMLSSDALVLTVCLQHAHLKFYKLGPSSYPLGSFCKNRPVAAE